MPSPLALALECASVSLLVMVSGLIVFVPYTPPHDCESPLSAGFVLNGEVDEVAGIGGDGNGSEMEEDGSFFRTLADFGFRLGRDYFFSHTVIQASHD